VLSVEHVTYVYRTPLAPDRRALADVSLTVDPDEIVAIVGASGSGKTTLIQHLNGLLRPTEGCVCFDGMDLGNPRTDRRDVRRRVGLVFQFPEIQLFEETVYRDVAFGPRNLGWSEDTVEGKVRWAMTTMGLDYDDYRDASPFHLSGGEKRRAAIAGVLAMEPQILVMDEPTVALDGLGTKMIEKVMDGYHRNGRAVVFESHDMDLVSRLVKRVIVLSEGRVVYDGSKEKLFDDEGMLERAGLELPRVCRFMRRVRRTHSVRTDIYTIDEAKKELASVLGEPGDQFS
jgi:energy-coupling factor transport system ATP-binding protein